MKKYIILLFFVGIHFYSNTCFAQQEIHTKVLNIGDTLDGDIAIELFKGRITQKRTLADYRGKWLILDFWETFCMPCIIAMPKFDSLNMDYKDQLEIVLVTKTTQEKVMSFVDKSPIAKFTNHTFIVNDTLLKRLFPHRIIPHEVWIDPDGVVRAITGGEDVNSENIDAILANRKTAMREKKESLRWRRDKMVDGGTEDRLLFRSVLKKYDLTAPQSGWFTRGAGTIFEDSLRHRTIKYIYQSNYTPVRLFYEAFMFWKYGGAGNINPNYMAIEIKDENIRKRYADDRQKWPFDVQFHSLGYEDRYSYYEENLFCYEMILPDYLPDSTAFKFMINDLNRYFPIKARVEKRIVKCLILKVDNSGKTEELLKSHSNQEQSKITESKIILKKYPFYTLMNNLLKMISRPIIDETEINYNIDVELDFGKSKFLDPKQGLVLNLHPFDEAIFRKEMKKYGIKVIKKDRLIDVLVVHD